LIILRRSETFLRRSVILPNDSPALSLSVLNEKINEKELSGFVDDALDDIERFAANVTLDDIKKFPNLNRK
jgi:hypothetical protein